MLRVAVLIISGYHFCAALQTDNGETTDAAGSDSDDDYFDAREEFEDRSDEVFPTGIPSAPTKDAAGEVRSALRQQTFERAWSYNFLEFMKYFSMLDSKAIACAAKCVHGGARNFSAWFVDGPQPSSIFLAAKMTVPTFLITDQVKSKVSVQTIELSSKGLVELRKFKKSVTNLTLEVFDNVSGEMWDELFDILKTMPRLREVTVDGKNVALTIEKLVLPDAVEALTMTSIFLNPGQRKMHAANLNLKLHLQQPLVLPENLKFLDVERVTDLKELHLPSGVEEIRLNCLDCLQKLTLNKKLRYLTLENLDHLIFEDGKLVLHEILKTLKLRDVKSIRHICLPQGGTLKSIELEQLPQLSTFNGEDRLHLHGNIESVILYNLDGLEKLSISPSGPMKKIELCQLYQLVCDDTGEEGKLVAPYNVDTFDIHDVPYLRKVVLPKISKHINLVESDSLEFRHGDEVGKLVIPEGVEHLLCDQLRHLKKLELPKNSLKSLRLEKLDDLVFCDDGIPGKFTVPQGITDVNLFRLPNLLMLDLPKTGLEHLDLCNLPFLDFHDHNEVGQLWLEEGISGVCLAELDHLQKVHLPSSLTSVSLIDLNDLEFNDEGQKGQLILHENVKDVCLENLLNLEKLTLPKEIQKIWLLKLSNLSRFNADTEDHGKLVLPKKFESLELQGLPRLKSLGALPETLTFLDLQHLQHLTFHDDNIDGKLSLPSMLTFCLLRGLPCLMSIEAGSEEFIKTLKRREMIKGKLAHIPMTVRQEPGKETFFDCFTNYFNG